ncbi:MAG TPA: UDP-N-acetylmuramoyl-L-alanine--D-glutamate ligase [Trebonia sp.]|nr:UDP-N-acetylmuramoyl-L-alanine--D-glutamate ligase [Trebonia sp.]
MTGQRQQLGWSDLRSAYRDGARVGVWGLGQEGQATVRKLHALGIAPVLVDDSPNDSGVLPTADGGLDALKKADVVIKTPGISPYGPAAVELRTAGVTLVGGLGLWANEADRSRVVYVTGTKGKSTTSSVIGHLLRGLGRKALVGGNFGAAPYDPERAGDYDYWVIEVSSYTATDLAVTPPVTAVTSLHPDHLPWHGGVERYYTDKLSATSQPGADLTVANGDSELLRERAGLLGPRVEWVSETDDPGATWMDPLHLQGRHNRRNALIARATLRALAAAAGDGELSGQVADDERLAAAAAGFTPLPSRLTPVGTVGGVTFVDDSLSTNVLPTLAALDSFPGQRVALIVGGQDRGIDYTALAEGVTRRVEPTYVLTLPDSGRRITAAFTATAATADPGFTGIADCADLDEAVTRAFAWARPDGVVLLSPAAPSFGRFRDYRDRGDHFAAAMRALPSPA